MEAARSQKLGPAGRRGAFFFLEGGKRKDAKARRRKEGKTDFEQEGTETRITRIPSPPPFGLYAAAAFAVV